MIGIKQAIEQYHADGIELDIHITADSNFIAYHDQKLDSKTNKSGYPELMTWDEIKGAEYKVGFPFDLFQEEKVMKFQTIINYLLELEEFPILQIDLRHYCMCFTPEENARREAGLIKKLIDFLQLLEVPESKIQIISGSKSLISIAQSLACPYELLFEVGQFDTGLEWAVNNGIKTMVVNRPILDSVKSRLAHEQGIAIVTFEAKSDQGHQTLIHKNPDYIQTNNLASLNRLLKFKP